MGLLASSASSRQFASSARLRQPNVARSQSDVRGARYAQVL
jgi:hypothetical protein